MSTSFAPQIRFIRLGWIGLLGVAAERHAQRGFAGL
jgi:hypothetical protein